MGLRNSLLWYTQEKTTANKTYIKEFVQTSGDWDALIEEVSVYVNTVVPPHQLVDIDFWEESHPNVPVKGETKIYACVLQNAGEDP